MPIYTGSSFEMAAALPLDTRDKVADLAARDALSALRRYEGLTCYVVSEGKRYHLVGGITNAHWQELGGISSLTDLTTAINNTTFYTANDGNKHILWGGYPNTYIGSHTIRGNADMVKVSPNGKYLAVTHGTSPYLDVYAIDYQAARLLRIESPAIAVGSVLEWTPDSKCFITNSNTATTNIYVYKINELNMSVSQTGSLAVTGWSGINYKNTAFTNDSKILVAGCTGTSSGGATSVRAFNINTTAGTISLRGNINSVTTAPSTLSINPVTNVLAFQDSSPISGAVRFFSYDSITNNFTLSFYDVFPSPLGKMQWDISGSYLAITTATSFGVIVIKNLDLIAQTYSTLSTSGVADTGTKVNINWHPSGEYFLASSGSTVRIYTVNSTTVTSAGTLTPAFSAAVLRSDMSPNGKLFFASINASTALQIYQAANTPGIISYLSI